MNKRRLGNKGMPEVSRLGEFKGQGFESLQARQRKASKLLKFRGFCYMRFGRGFFCFWVYFWVYSVGNGLIWRSKWRPQPAPRWRLPGL